MDWLSDLWDSVTGGVSIENGETDWHVSVGKQRTPWGWYVAGGLVLLYLLREG